MYDVQALSTLFKQAGFKKVVQGKTLHYSDLAFDLGFETDFSPGGVDGHLVIEATKE